MGIIIFVFNTNKVLTAVQFNMTFGKKASNMIILQGNQIPCETGRIKYKCIQCQVEKADMVKSSLQEGKSNYFNWSVNIIHINNKYKGNA